MRRQIVRTVLTAALLARAAGAQTHVLVFSGLGGEPRFSDRFRQMASSLVVALRESHLLDSALAFKHHLQNAAAGQHDARDAEVTVYCEQ